MGKSIGWIIAAVAATLAAGAYLFFNKSPTASTTPNNASAQNEVSASASEAKTEAASHKIFLSADEAGMTMASIPGGECWIDYFEQSGLAVAGKIQNDKETQIYGWGMPTKDPIQTDHFLIEFKPIDGTPPENAGFIRVNAGIERPDISKAKGSVTYQKAGFYNQFTLDGAPSGRYHLYLNMSSNSQLFQCDLNREVEI